MPYASNSDLPQSVRDKYSEKCQRAFRHAFNTTHADTGSEERAFASAHAAAKRCMEAKTMTIPADHRFKIYSGVLKSIESEDGRKRLKTTASSTIKDLSGDEMTENAIRRMAESARNNMTIFLNHSYSVPEDVFGSVEDVAIQQRDEHYDLDFDIVLNESNPRAVQAYDAISNGTKLGTSIGAVIREPITRNEESGGYIFDNVELLEASIVGIPANPRSWVQYARKSLDDAEREEQKATTWIDVDSKGNTKVVVDVDEDEHDALDEAKSSEPPEPTAAPEEKEEETKTDPAAQEAHKSAPESAGDTDDQREGVPPLDADLADLVGLKSEELEVTPEMAEMTGLKSTDLNSLISTLARTTGELVDAKKALGDEIAAHAVTKELLKQARRDQKQMRSIIEKVASLPIGRRAQFDQQVTEFRTRFAGLYDDDFLQLLERPSDDRSD